MFEMLETLAYKQSIIRVICDRIHCFINRPNLQLHTRACMHVHIEYIWQACALKSRYNGSSVSRIHELIKFVSANTAHNEAKIINILRHTKQQQTDHIEL